MKTKHLLKILFLPILMFYSFSVIASTPQSLSYQAYLSDATGAPVNGIENITVRLYDGDTSDVNALMLWSETFSVNVDKGLFAVTLGSVSNPLPKAAMNHPLWLGIEINNDGEAVPRSPLLNTNNTFKTDDTQQLGNQSSEHFQQRVGGNCPPGQSIREIDASGSVICEVDDDSTYSGNDFVPSNQSCAPYDVATGVDNVGNLLCSNAVRTNTSKINSLDNELNNHTSDTNNPHSVNATQIGSATSTDLTKHETDPSAHHKRFTDADALNALKAGDGAGSSLDADRVSGINSSAFIRSDVSDSYTKGTLTFNAGTAAQLNGIVQIGAASSIDDDILYFDDGISEYLRWAEAPHRFEISDNLQLDGILTIGPTSGAAFAYNLMRNTINDLPDSGDISNAGDLFVGYDLELGGEIYANRYLYMNGFSKSGQDADQTIYFYDSDNRQGQYLRWNDLEARFDISANLHVNGNVISEGVLHSRQDIKVAGVSYIGYEYIQGDTSSLNKLADCRTFGICRYGTATASCSAGKVILSGGCSCLFNDFRRECYVTASERVGDDTWRCNAVSPGRALDGIGKITALITCAKLGS